MSIMKVARGVPECASVTTSPSEVPYLSQSSMDPKSSKHGNTRVLSVCPGHESGHGDDEVDPEFSGFTMGREMLSGS